MSDQTPEGFALGLLARFLPMGQVPIGENQIAAAWGSSDTCPMVPRNEWITQPVPAWAEYRDVDQGQTPSCCLASLANAIEFFLAIHGRQKITLDWRRAWVELTGGRGGAAIHQAMTYVTTKGYPLIGSPQRIHVTEIWDVDNADAYFSGVLRGCTGWYGHWVPGGGHAEAGLAVDVSGRDPVMVSRGSWGRRAGENGWFRRTYSDLQQGIPQFGAGLIREVEVRETDLAKVPDVKERA